MHYHMAKQMTGEQLRRIRRQRGMTQEDLALALEIGRSAVAKMETGVAAITPSRAKMIRLVLKMRGAA